MNLLLDTHALLWWLADDQTLSECARAAIANPRHDVFVSAATAWEIAIKSELGKVGAPENLEAALEANRFRALAISVTHATTAGRLPEHHRAPFARVLIAQAQLKGLTLVTRDCMFEKYGVDRLHA